MNTIPREFDIIRTARPGFPNGIGYTMHGWDFDCDELTLAQQKHTMLNPAMELGTNYCPWNCSFCFTEDPSNPEGEKRRLASEMSLERRLLLIEEAAKLGARSINFIGAGEPTIDPNFWKLMEQMKRCGITPIVYTEGALRLTDKSFAERLYEVGATVVFKVNSLWNSHYQNAIVAGSGVKKQPRAQDYTASRNNAIETCIKVGFNKHDPTRLAFDTIVCHQNITEVHDLHRWARQHNVFVLFVNYLPSGRSSDGLHDAISREEQFKLFDQLAQIDEKEFGLKHSSKFPYAGGTPCSIRGMGLYIKIGGKVWDCPGELTQLGNLQNESLEAIWGKVRPITKAFDGGCAPRDHFWRQQASQKALPVLP